MFEEVTTAAGVARLQASPTRLFGRLPATRGFRARNRISKPFGVIAGLAPPSRYYATGRHSSSQRLQSVRRSTKLLGAGLLPSINIRGATAVDRGNSRINNKERDSGGYYRIRFRDRPHSDRVTVSNQVTLMIIRRCKCRCKWRGRSRSTRRFATTNCSSNQIAVGNRNSPSCSM